MEGLGYVCALVMAGVFVWAGTAKLVRPEPTAASFSALGVPAPTAAARAMPVVELVLAVLLAASPRAGGAAALVVLGVFTAVLARAVIRGTAAPCACFGTARAEPVSGVDVLRNALLGALALCALLTPAPAAPSGGEVAVALAVCAVAALVLRAARG